MKQPLWMIYARGYLGISEVKGTQHNPLIVNMFKRIQLPMYRDDETSWCAAFVGSCLEEAGIQSSRSARALSYEKWGIGLPYPAVGAIAYKTRKNSSGSVIGGHVTFVYGETPNGQLLCIGGNQGDCVGIDKYERSDIVGYRWPTKVPLPSRELPILTDSGKLIAVNEA